MSERRDLWWDSPTRRLGKVVPLALEEPFRTRLGGEIPAIQVSYEAWGELSPSRDNAVLVVHPLTTDCHLTGAFAGEPQGWWEDLVGPGRALDTERFHVICPDLLGGCHGTTGPRFPAPDGEPWLGRFPLLTPRDLMRAGRLFLDALGIRRLAMVIGPSLGGMVAWEWAVEASDRVAMAVVVAAPLATTPLQIGWNWLQRRAIELDLRSAGGGRDGRAVARGVGMLSYRSPKGLEEKFGRTWFQPPGTTLAEPGIFNVESWLHFHGKRIVKRFDPYTYLLLSRAMDLHDLAEGRDGGLEGALGRVRCPVLVLGISSDQLYPAADVRRGAELPARFGCDARYAEIDSPHGHDAFLLETGRIARILAEHRAPAAPPRG